MTNTVSTEEIAATLGVGANRSRARRRKKIAWIVGIALVVIGGFALLSRLRKPAPLTYQVAKVTRGELKASVSSTGSIEPLNAVDVGAEVSGRLIAVHVDFNDIVKKGQVLAEIDAEQVRATVEQSKAQLLASQAGVAQAKATLTELETVLKRTKGMAETGLVPKAELEGAEAAAARAKAALASANANAQLARAALNSTQTLLGRTTIRSPIDGIVLARLVEAGQTVTAGFQTPLLFRLAENLSRMKLKVGIDEADIGRVREGQKATFSVDAFSGRTFESTIISLRNDPQITQNVVTYEAILSVDNKDGVLRPGMTATVTIVVETRKDVLLMPNAALRFSPQDAPDREAGDDASRVWLEGKGGPVALAIKAGLSDGSHTEVLDGDLKEGALVITDVEAR